MLKIKTTNDKLLAPLQQVTGIVERRHTLPILANVLLEQRNDKLYVTATDLEMQITAYSELSGKQDQSITVAARKLQDLLRALPDDAAVNVETSASKMTVRASRSRLRRALSPDQRCVAQSAARTAETSAQPLTQHLAISPQAECG